MGFFYCPGKRLFTEHRCVTHLYRIPVGSFNYVAGELRDLSHGLRALSKPGPKQLLQIKSIGTNL